MAFPPIRLVPWHASPSTVGSDPMAPASCHPSFPPPESRPISASPYPPAQNSKATRRPSRLPTAIYFTSSQVRRPAPNSGSAIFRMTLRLHRRILPICEICPMRLHCFGDFSHTSCGVALSRDCPTLEAVTATRHGVRLARLSGPDSATA